MEAPSNKTTEALTAPGRRSPWYGCAVNGFGPGAPLAALLLAVLLGACSRQQTPPAAAAPPPAAPPAPAAYVGSSACAECHPTETQAWSTSHHRLAMQPATDATVLGDFHDAHVTLKGVGTTFLHPDGGFAVRTDGPDGKLAEFPIRFTFGIEPLQQYLVEFPKGRLQSLGIAWDTRPASEGGQRWFHLYPGELQMDFRNALHWTRPLQNWNYMCGACHTTDFQKNYRAETDAFDTAYSEGNVGCEACHGPASGHLDWARSAKRPADGLKGLTFALRGASAANWGKLGTNGTLTREGPISRVEVETCGPCHSRRGQTWPTAAPGAPIGQAYRVALLEEGLYEPDGQIHDEVFEYGSFLQSKMYQHGVTCSDCHEPHAAKKLRSEGNGVCTHCHLAARFDTPEHHHHPAGTAGAQCVGCHMAMRTYMVLDGRRDHSFRIPRPDLALKLGTPDACTGCHQDKGVRWTAERAQALWGPSLAAHPQWGEAIDAGRRWLPGAGDKLMATAGDTNFPGIVRATATGLLEGYPDPQLVPLLERLAVDADPLVRRAAAHTLAGQDTPERIRLTAPLLADPIRDVRLEATATMVSVPPRELDASTRAALAVAVRERRASLASDADRSEAQYNLGVLELALSNPAAAEAAFRLAIQRDPTFGLAYLNLAEVLRGTGREAEAEKTLREALRVDAGDAAAYHSLGLSMVRQGRKAEALPLLEKAARLGAANPRFAYVYAIALQDSGDHRSALSVLERTQARFPGNLDILTLLVQFNRNAGNADAARRWARKLAAAAPNLASVQQFVQSVEQGTP
ncbi:MAG: tetratricopeptide repeat protein [Myxococcaceae bacterium]